MPISIYQKLNEYSGPILNAMLYVNFYIIKTSKEVLGININSVLIRNLLLTITFLFMHIYLEKETEGVEMINAGYVLG